MTDDENTKKLEGLLAYFRSHKLWQDYEVTKRYVFDQRATRFDFVRGADHFMLDVSDSLITDEDFPRIQKRLNDSNWSSILTSYAAPGFVTFSREGFSFSQKSSITEKQPKSFSV
jgi:hypothetical protein